MKRIKQAWRWLKVRYYDRMFRIGLAVAFGMEFMVGLVVLTIGLVPATAGGIFLLTCVMILPLVVIWGWA